MRQTIKQILQSAYRQIDKLDADLLLSLALCKPREYFIIHEDDIINNAAKNKFKKLIKKRKNGTPLAYITGHKEFFGLDFLVNKHTLIPRPDTEIMAEEVLERIKNQPRTTRVHGRESTTHHKGVWQEIKNTILIDVGTGTGCIPISILKNVKQPLTVFATDISSQALKVAKKNTKIHNMEINFVKGNLLQSIIHNSKFMIHDSSLIITANLPYLTEEQYQSEKSIQHEPKSALVAKKEGLALYEKLLKQIKKISKTYNLKPKTYIEIDPSQSEKITALIKQILPETKVEIKKDLSGRNRLVIIN